MVHNWAAHLRYLESAVVRFSTPPRPQLDMLWGTVFTALRLLNPEGDKTAVQTAIAKVKDAGNPNVMITERGVTFGYNTLVVDFRGLPRMRALPVPVCFDATHSVQLPGAQGQSSGGEREFIAPLARAAVAVGVDALFFEVHDDPAHALCDGPSQLSLDSFPAILDGILAIDRAAREHPIPLP